MIPPQQLEVMNEKVKIEDCIEKKDTLSQLTEEEIGTIQKSGLRNCALSFIEYLETHRPNGKMCMSNGECEDVVDAFLNNDWRKLHRYYCKFIAEEDKELIPLTDEILLNNGFERIDTDRTLGEYVLRIESENMHDCNAREFYRIATYSNGGRFVGDFQIRNRTKDDYVSCYITCKYVHEFKQVLRMCKLNEIADNFKI